MQNNANSLAGKKQKKDLSQVKAFLMFHVDDTYVRKLKDLNKERACIN